MNESWLILDTMLSQETDRDARLREQFSDELRHLAGTVEQHPRNANELLLAELFPSESDSEPEPEPEPQSIAQSIEPKMLQPDSPRQTGISIANDRRLPLKPPDRPLTRSFIADDNWSSSEEEISRHDPARRYADLVEPTKPVDDARSTPTDAVLDRYARTAPLDSPLPVAGDVISRQSSPGVDFPEARRAIPAGAVKPRESRGGHKDEGESEFPFVVPEERAPIDLPRFSRAFPRDLAINAPAMIEPSRKSERIASPAADSQASATTDELERLRSAARRTADELEKIRGPVPAAFPARPPAFRDRS